uniref:Uncharacterized protein n=1 Tax=Medicago truncatula TaxID=3880 RepID=I3SV24_MEDTR|nr:unknown [Medicago truncatula]
MSAQETVPGQNISRTLFAVSITENPPTDLFPGSLCSVLFPCSIKDASHPSLSIKH